MRSAHLSSKGSKFPTQQGVCISKLMRFETYEYTLLYTTPSDKISIFFHNMGILNYCSLFYIISHYIKDTLSLKSLSGLVPACYKSAQIAGGV